MCNMCKISETTKRIYSPHGTETPVIYIVGEAMSPEEYSTGVTFSGMSSTYLKNIMATLGLSESNCRFNNCVRCYPSNGGGGYRSPTTEEMDNCNRYLYADISLSNPKIIITLGSTVSKYIIGDRFTYISKDRGKIFDTEIMGKTYKVMPVYHPTYVYKNSRTESIQNEFKTDLKTAISICAGETVNSVSILKDISSKTVEIGNYDEFNEFCKEYIDDFHTIAFDVETNALDTHSVDHEVVGFSLASSKDIGCYVCLKSLDYVMEEDDRKLIEKRLRMTLSSSHVIVYNCLHELPATLNWLDLEMTDIDDVWIMVKLMMGTADTYEGNGGLKRQCVLNLHSEDWSKDLDRYIKLMNTISASSKKSEYSEETESELRELLSKYYSGALLDNIVNLAIDFAINVIPDSPSFSYEFVPRKLISRYGSIDSSILFELRDFYFKWMDEEGEKLGINLRTGYKYWLWHHYSGYILERNGAFWNEEKAKKVEDWCNTGKYNTLKTLILSPLSRSYIKSTSKQQYLKWLLENNPYDLVDCNKYTIKRKYATSLGVEPNSEAAALELKRMSILPNKQGIYKLALGNLEFMGREFIKNNPEKHDKWLDQYIIDNTGEGKTHDDLKKIFNPNSTADTFKDFVSEILITPLIRYAKLYDNIVKFTEEPDFNLEEFIDTNISDSDSCELVAMVYKLRVSDMSSSEKFDMFLEFMNEQTRNFRTYRIKRAVNEALRYKFESMDAAAFNEIYELYLMCHIDVENRETWNKEFEWIYNYKMYKKFSKLLSTYVDGKVGRKSVYEVDKASYSNGDKFTRREREYSKDRVLPADKMYMSQTSFKVNMADTGRWTAGIHNLPASDVIKGIFTSRFKGGCIAMPDGSQMEVRTLAAECGDEALLQAFKDGVDIHRFFASRIYQVPYDEVQKWQRGLAKNAVFGLLYGESEQAFADSYLNGDLVRAHEIFEGMFSGFPRIKEYIDRKHKQYQDERKVTTLTQRFINLANSRENPNRLLRMSQNYPIQASAEDIAGVILYKLCEWLEENNMKSKPFCFIHDSIEIDIHPDEAFFIIDKLDYLFNKFPLEEFNVPVACDIPISMNMGTEIEVKHIEADKEYNDVNIILSGYTDDIEDLIDNWKTVYRVVEKDETYEPEEPDKQIYMPISERFLPKKAPISMKQGTYRTSTECKYHIIRK